MGKKPLAAEGIEELRSSPRAANIIFGRISLTPEFKSIEL